MSMLTLITLILVAMKLAGYISSEWWLVLLPSTLEVFIGAALLVGFLIMKPGKKGR